MQEKVRRGIRTATDYVVDRVERMLEKEFEKVELLSEDGKEAIFGFENQGEPFSLSVNKTP
jgi:hypothetical protein